MPAEKSAEMFVVYPCELDRTAHRAVAAGMASLYRSLPFITKPNMEMCKQYCHCLVVMFTRLSLSLHGKHG